MVLCETCSMIENIYSDKCLWCLKITRHKQERSHLNLNSDFYNCMFTRTNKQKIVCSSMDITFCFWLWNIFKLIKENVSSKDTKKIYKTAGWNTTAIFYRLRCKKFKLYWYVCTCWKRSLCEKNIAMTMGNEMRKLDLKFPQVFQLKHLP